MAVGDGIKGPGVNRSAGHAADDTRPRRPSRCDGRSSLQAAVAAAASGGLLQVTETTWRQHFAARSSISERGPATPAAKGGSRNDQVEAVPRLRRAGMPAHRRRLDARRSQPEALRGSARSSAAAVRSVLHQHRAGGTTRQRLEAQRTTAREQVEHAHAGNMRCAAS